MTIAEMHTLMDLELDKSNAPWFNAIEKDILLNLAQNEFVKTRHRQFEFDEKRRNDLLPLVRRQTFTSVSQINLNTDIQDFLFVISLGAKITHCGRSFVQKISPEQEDDKYESEHDPFNKTAEDNLKYLEYNNGTDNLIDIKSPVVPDEVYLTYLKVPIKVSLSGAINCELEPIFHEEIVNLAVRKSMMVSEDPNYQAQINEINNQE